MSKLFVGRLIEAALFSFAFKQYKIEAEGASLPDNRYQHLHPGPSFQDYNNFRCLASCILLLLHKGVEILTTPTHF